MSGQGGGRYLRWINLGLFFHFLVGGIGPGVRPSLAEDAPGYGVLAGGGACFIRRVRGERLGFKCRGFLCPGLVFFLGGYRGPFRRNYSRGPHYSGRSFPWGRLSC